MRQFCEDSSDMLHPVNKNGGLKTSGRNQFLYAFGVGLFLGYVYCRTRKVLYTMLVHVLLNTISSSIMLLVPSMKGDSSVAAIIIMSLFLMIAVLFYVVSFRFSTI